MKSSAYILLDAVEGRVEKLARRLVGRGGVRAVHQGDRPTGRAATAGAKVHNSLSELTVEVLVWVDDLTVQLDCPPMCGRHEWRTERDKEPAMV